MDINIKKNFFKRVAGLPLEKKVQEVFETFDLLEANDMALKLIGRSKELSLQEKERLLEKYFPGKVTELLPEVTFIARRKPHDLPNKLHLTPFIRQNCKKGGLLDFSVAEDGFPRFTRLTLYEKNKRFLNTVACFLNQKYAQREYVDKVDCKKIKTYLMVKLYQQYQDEMNAIITAAFQFKKQRIKQIVSAFYDEVITETGKIDKVLFLPLLRGAYLSPEVYSLLTTHAELITADENLGRDVIAEIEKLKQEDLNATTEELTMIDNALALLNRKMEKFN